jgi:molybdate transport system permease protein
MELFPGLGPLVLTVKLAALTTVILLLLGTPVAWWLANTRIRLKPLFETIVALPLVLPPTVMGFYLLLMLGPKGWVGGIWMQLTGSPLTFSFTGLVVASVIYSFPFVVQPLHSAFEGVGKDFMEAARTLGANRLDAFFSIAAPLARRGFLTATVLGFAHTLGEFGVVLMVGGNIPGETRVISIAIYDHVEMLDYGKAQTLSAILLGFAFIAMLSMYIINHRDQVRA